MKSYVLSNGTTPKALIKFLDTTPVVYYWWRHPGCFVKASAMQRLGKGECEWVQGYFENFSPAITKWKSADGQFLLTIAQYPDGKSTVSAFDLYNEACSLQVSEASGSEKWEG